MGDSQGKRRLFGVESLLIRGRKTSILAFIGAVTGADSSGVFPSRCNGGLVEKSAIVEGLSKDDLA